MKNRISSLNAFASLCIAISLFSCSKQRIQEQEKVTMNQYQPVNTYLDTKKQQEQEFIIDSTGSGPIVGNQGTKIWTSKHCLQLPNGDSVTWPFTVKLVELYKPKDMIYYQMPTLAGGKILETGGEIRLRAFKNGTELTLKPGCGTQIEMPHATPKNYMRVFNGITTNTLPDWLEEAPVNAFTATTTGHKALINKLGWINCDFTIGNGSGSTISFTSSTDELQNLGIFVYIPAHKTVMQVYGTTSALIPNGTAVKVVLIGVNASGQLYSYYQSATINSNTTIDVTMAATTDADLTTLLDGL